MYCGSVDLTKLQSREILNLLLSSDKFELQPLVTYIQEILIKNHEDFINKNIREIIELIYLKKFNKLWDFCIHEICYSPDWYITINNLNPILKMLLKRDILKLFRKIILQ